MFETIDQKLAVRAATYLAQNDATLAPIIASAGPCTIAPHRDYYRALVGEIIGQQLHVKAAASIRKRFEALFGEHFPEPAEILATSVETLRSVGLSRAKAAYIRDIAQHVVDGKLSFGRLDDMSNAEIIAHLTDVKGIGEWTAHMFLMFCMGRPDVLATGDLGIRNGVKKLYDLDHTPSADELRKLSTDNHWAPYETIACWYIWYSLDNKPA